MKIDVIWNFVNDIESERAKWLLSNTYTNKFD
jgi:hypothetical protein